MCTTILAHGLPLLWREGSDYHPRGVGSYWHHVSLEQGAVKCFTVFWTNWPQMPAQSKWGTPGLARGSPET